MSSFIHPLQITFMMDFVDIKRGGGVYLATACNKTLHDFN